ncbi:hypothetical protein Tco_0063432, partial [Tanacetum coccineum]
GIIDYSASTADGDCRVAGSRPYPTSTTYGDIDTDEDTANTGDSTPESASTQLEIPEEASSSS